MSLLRDYSRQARTYDETRAASPSVLGPLREALNGAPGRRLADVGGGTGNYSLALRDEGWDPLVIDRQPEMLARAAAKGLKTLEGDAQRLPLADASMDAVMLVSMLHHVEQPALALAEARRVLRPGGRLALMVFTREDVAAMWLNDYFPSTRAWMRQSHPTLAELLALLPGARRLEVVYRDVEDGSLAALAGHPERLVDPRWHRQTSYFDRLERDHPTELRAGLARLRADLDAGRAPDTRGSATVLAYEQAAGRRSC
jgi:SAM-dependent methyltransferase